jgi:hypothetical protein
MRRESKDLKTAASVQVLTGEQIKETGASNLLEALKFATGLTYDGYGAMGHLYSSMTAKIVIRGMDRGTVILLDGSRRIFPGIILWSGFRRTILRKWKSSKELLRRCTALRQWGESSILSRKKG